MKNAKGAAVVIIVIFGIFFSILRILVEYWTYTLSFMVLISPIIIYIKRNRDLKNNLVAKKILEEKQKIEVEKLEREQIEKHRQEQNLAQQRILAEQQAEKQRQERILAEQQAEKQRQERILAEQQRQEKVSAENQRQRQERILAEQQRQERQNLANERAFAKAMTEFTSISKPHLKTLALKRNQLVTYDDYGNPNFRKYIKELDYFISQTVFRIASEENKLYLFNLHKSSNQESNLSTLVSTLDKLVVNHINENLTENNPLTKEKSIKDFTPEDFEMYCRDLLIRKGWKASLTKSSGDQGIDIIATYKNIKVVFQCKLYASSVGNSAVQEIFAGKVFEQAHFAAVVSNNTYTQSAQQLAQSTKVLLLHYSNLSELAFRLGLEVKNE